MKPQELLTHQAEPDLTDKEKTRLINRLRRYPLTGKPWSYKQALYRARRASIKDDQIRIVIVDFDYHYPPEPVRYFDYCTWTDYLNQQMPAWVVRQEITRGEITESF